MSLGALDEVSAFEAGSGADEGHEVGRLTALQRAWADSTCLKTMASAAVALPASLATLALSRTVVEVDSMGFGVRT